MKSNTIKWLISYSVIFVGLFVFMAMIHPLHIFTVDDWYNIVNEREPFPYTGIQNPGKVLPETFFPMMAELARCYIYPFTHDFIGSITIVSSFFLTVIAIIYFYQITSCINRENDVNQRIILLFILVVMHFYLYRNHQSMFSNSNMTDQIHYLLPYMLNALTVCLFMKKENGKQINGVDILLVYLCIFSNMFQNIILVTYCFFRMIRDLVRQEDKRLRSVVQNNLLWITTLVIWGIDLWTEKHGNRASALGDTNLSFDIKVGLRNYYIKYGSIRKCVIYVSIFLCLLALFSMARRQRMGFKKLLKHLLLEKQLGVLICSFVITSLYMVLLDTYINSIDYLWRTDVYNTILFYPILIAMWVVGYVIRNKSFISVVMPVILYIMIFQCIFHVTPVGHETFGIDKKETQDKIIEELIQAGENGIDEITLYVSSEFTDEASRVWLEEFIPRALYSYGVINRPVQLNLTIEDAKTQSW